MPNLVDKFRAAVTGDDSERLARRREIHKQLADLKVIEGRYVAIGQQLQGLSTRENTAVANHQKSCAPIQATLERIEGEITELILANKPMTDSLAKERAEALDKLAIANAKLEAEVETLKKLRRQAETQRKQLAPQFAEIPHVRAKLTAFGVANRELLRQRFVCDQAYLSADQRRRGAERSLADVQATLRLQQNERERSRGVNSLGEVYHEPVQSEHALRLEREVDNWLAELAAAEEALTKCEKAKQQIREKILAE